MSHFSLRLAGVSCQGCINKIVKKGQSLDETFAIASTVANKTEHNTDYISARVSTALSLDETINLIESVGFTAEQGALPSYVGAVQNVSCQKCVGKITGALRELDELAEVSIDLDTQSIEVIGLLSPQQITSSLTELGYAPNHNEAQTSIEQDNSTNTAPQQVNSSEQLVRLNLFGVTCASCVASIEKAVNSAIATESGHESITINFANRTASVYSSLTESQLVQTIENAGYGASVIVDETAAESEREQRQQQEYQHKIRHTIGGLSLGVPLMLYGMLGGSMTVNTTQQQLAWGLVGLLTLAVLWFSGRHYFIGASKAFKNRNANMDTLIALGTGSAWLYSIVVVLMPALLPDSARHLYFEASAMIIGLINLGQALELKARGRTSQAIKRLLDLRTKTALVIKNGKAITLPVEEVQIGDLVLIRAGEKIPVDGQVIEGESLIDESMLTGEPIPVLKSIKDTVSAGTINGEQNLTIQASKVGSDTMLAQIIEMVSNAQNSKPAISHLADKVSSVFVPTVMILSIITALMWYNFGPAPTVINMLVTATSVLIIACPCALGLATPISTMIGIGKSAEFGGLIRNGDALQMASNIDVVILDKTGTITQGKPSVANVEHVRENPFTLDYLTALEQGSTHPLANAVVSYCAQHKSSIAPLAVADFINLTGRGVTANIDGHSLLLGNQRLMREQGVDISDVAAQAEQWEAMAHTVIYFAMDKQLHTLLSISDPIKTESASAIAALTQLGIKVMMLTGDNEHTAKAVAQQTGVDEFHGELLPQDKLQWVETLQQQGLVVAMVGDGINDAPALAKANVGFAIGQGTDVAIESADITLIRGSLFGVSQVIEVSKATMRNIKQNLWGAFIYNSVGIPIAAGVLYPLFGVLLSPIVAGVAMSLSSITVVSNANRLRLFTPKTQEPSQGLAQAITQGDQANG
ncbi:heavy metal translocating P-type ATPase [Vibrio ezurae]|uniref:Copper-exporting P-type ATPase n=1 Tax=Vibrio ezurae NBRC 102218 TaxID=1219080 RepID=U3CCS8_9VIBR|nr:heavy metal translocating P-type ATPase [Vibrio ezurae]GAD79104.1 copper-transporting P-type ATPase CopA [Vibrio ezurae NBRC 102218]